MGDLSIPPLDRLSKSWTLPLQLPRPMPMLEMSNAPSMIDGPTFSVPLLKLPLTFTHMLLLLPCLLTLWTELARPCRNLQTTCWVKLLLFSDLRCITSRRKFLTIHPLVWTIGVRNQYCKGSFTPRPKWIKHPTPPS